MPQLEALMKRRSNIKGALTKISNYIIAQRKIEASKLDIDELRVRLRRVEGILTEFHDAEHAITLLNPDDESQQDEFEEKYYSAVAGLNRLIRISSMAVNISTTLNDTQGEPSLTTNLEVKLPKINIPPFFGSYTEWQSFYDLFAATIHENMNLNPAQKFQYLKGFLRGEAANLLKHLPISDTNYIEALNKLKGRYDRKRYSIQAFVKNFIGIPTIHNPTSQQIRNIMDTADEVLRGLRAIGPKAETRDPWLVHLLVQKLDEESRGQWARETADLEYPTCQALIEFLLKRADALDAAKGYPSPSATKFKPMPKTLTSSAVSCSICHNPFHPLFQCPKFKGWSSEERRTFAKNENRCFNCLSKTHCIPLQIKGEMSCLSTKTQFFTASGIC